MKNEKKKILQSIFRLFYRSINYFQQMLIKRLRLKNLNNVAVLRKTTSEIK